MSTNRGRRPRGSRPWARTSLAALGAGVLLAAGCGGDDAPAVCGSLESLSTEVEALQDIDIEVGEGAVADVEEALEAIQTDLESVKTDAEAELSEPIAALESSLDELSSTFETARVDDDLSSTEAESLLDSLAAVSTSLEALNDAAPCARPSAASGPDQQHAWGVGDEHGATASSPDAKNLREGEGGATYLVSRRAPRVGLNLVEPPHGWVLARADLRTNASTQLRRSYREPALQLDEV